jgi:hypothetical protein
VRAILAFYQQTNRLPPSLRGTLSYYYFEIQILTEFQHHQRLYTLDLQIEHAGSENMEKLGIWLLRRTRHCFEKRKAAEAVLATCGVPIETLRLEWEAQVKAQTKPLPRAQCFSFFPPVELNVHD